MRRIGWFAALLVPLWCAAQPESIRIGAIDFFGTSGLNVPAISAALPLHAGDTVTETDFSTLKPMVVQAVSRTAGKPATDVSAVCCDGKGGLLIYIGLPGRNSQALPHLAAPSGAACLPSAGLALYARMMDAVGIAVRENDTAEDHTNGYALSHNPALRKTQLAVRDYALSRAALLEQVLGD